MVGIGVNAVDVHELLSDILAAGFLDQRVNAVGVEPRDGEEIVWNSKFVQAAHGMLGHFDPSSIKCLSLAGSHTNCVLRIRGQEISHEGDEAICHEGRLNLELLRKKDVLPGSNERCELEGAHEGSRDALASSVEHDSTDGKCYYAQA